MPDLPFVTQRMEAGDRVFLSLDHYGQVCTIFRKQIFRRNIVLGLPFDQIRQVKGAVQARRQGIALAACSRSQRIPMLLCPAHHRGGYQANPPSV
jgi:hypothetical protein